VSSKNDIPSNQLACQHSTLRVGDTFDQLRKLDRCLFCERDRLRTALVAFLESVSGPVGRMDARLSLLSERSDDMDKIRDGVSALRSAISHVETKALNGKPPVCSKCGWNADDSRFELL
jgi:predicted Zn-ribbon and HTH transcriptional regulator